MLFDPWVTYVRVGYNQELLALGEIPKLDLEHRTPC
jgi:hypothetical protein